MWPFNAATTTYTHHPQPITLPTKSPSPSSTTLPALAESAIPPCHLHPLLFNGHLQTMWTAVRDAGPPIYYKRRIFESTHSVYPGQFTVDFVVPKPARGSRPGAGEDKADPTLPERTTHYSVAESEVLGGADATPMLICLHGLSGGSHEVYLREVVAPITAKGWEACVVNSRGCAQSKITTPRLFNARSTWDLRQTVRWLREKFPNRPLYAVGYSLGANMLTNYVAEEGERCVLKAAVACSNPWDLLQCHVGLMQTFLGQQVYSKVMGGNMRKLYMAHKEELQKNEGIDREQVAKVQHLWEFDVSVQVPSWNYPTHTAYYRDASSVDAVLGIRIPFLAINATDDPISQKQAIPYDEFKQNPYTVLCTTSWGGHLSWFQLGGKRWFATAIANFLTKMHDDVEYAESSDTEVEANGEIPGKKLPTFDPLRRKQTVPLE